MAHNKHTNMGNAVFVVGYRIRCYYSEEGATGNGQWTTDNGKEGTSMRTKLGFVPTFLFPVPWVPFKSPV